MESWYQYLQPRKRLIIANVAILIVLAYLSFTFFLNGHDVFPIRSSTTVAVPDAGSSAEPDPYDPSKLAFLVETRPIPHLPALFSHMVSVTPPEWRFMFMGSPEAIAFMRASFRISTLEKSKKLEITELPSNYTLDNRESISQMFTDPYLYSTLLAPAEHLLVFQPDSIFCTNSAETVNDWLDWDWVGAPWSTTAQHGGNGGLSLRKVSKVLQVLKKERRPDNDGELEDLWLTNRIAQLKGSNMPNATISKHFSVESVWDDKPLGYHVGWLGVHHGQIWDDQGQVNHILEYCPEVKLILGMKLDNDKPIGVPR